MVSHDDAGLLFLENVIRVVRSFARSIGLPLCHSCSSTSPRRERGVDSGRVKSAVA